VVQSPVPRLPTFLALGGGVLERLGANQAEQIMFELPTQDLMATGFESFRKRFLGLQPPRLFQAAPP
jgi:hypothetical protein